LKKSDRAFDLPKKAFVFRGYAKCIAPDKWIAVCLTVNLVTEGRTAAEALKKLSTLCEAYLVDAAEAGELRKWVPRRAPFAFYVEYGKALLAFLLHRTAQPLLTFREAKPFPVHAARLAAS